MNRCHAHQKSHWKLVVALSTVSTKFRMSSPSMRQCDIGVTNVLLADVGGCTVATAAHSDMKLARVVDGCCKMVL